MILLVGVPLLLAIGGGLDHAWQTMPRTGRPTSAGHLAIRLVSVVPAALVQLAAVVMVMVMVMVWQVITSAAGGDVVCAVALIPLAMVAGWRGWQISRRLGAGRSALPANDPRR